MSMPMSPTTTRNREQESAPMQVDPQSDSDGGNELPVASSLKALLSMMSITSHRGKLPRSKSSHSVKVSNRKKARLLPKSDRRGGRNKPIIVPHSSMSDSKLDTSIGQKETGAQSSVSDADEEVVRYTFGSGEKLATINRLQKHILARIFKNKAWRKKRSRSLRPGTGSHVKPKATNRPVASNSLFKAQAEKEINILARPCPPSLSTASSYTTAKIFFSRANSAGSGASTQSNPSLATPPALQANRSISSLISYELDHGPNGLRPGTSKGSLYEMLHEQQGPTHSLRPEDEKWLRENGYTAALEEYQHEMTQWHNELVMRRRQADPVVPLSGTSISLKDMCLNRAQLREEALACIAKAERRALLWQELNSAESKQVEVNFIGSCQWSSAPGSLGINTGHSYSKGSLTLDDVERACAMLEMIEEETLRVETSDIDG